MVTNAHLVPFFRMPLIGAAGVDFFRYGSAGYSARVGAAPKFGPVLRQDAR